MAGVLAEGDQAGQRGNQRAGAADVHAHQQIGVVAGELAEQDGRGHIADHLAGQDAEQQRAFLHQCGEKHAYRRNARHITGENEEENKRHQQRVVDSLQRVAIRKEQHKRNHHQTDPVGNAAEHDGDGQRKQREVQQRPLCREARRLFLDFKRFSLDENQAAGRNQRDRNGERQRHDPHEFARRDGEFGVQIQILRIAKGREHAAQVGRNVLQNERDRHVLFLAGGRKHEIAQRQERQQRHIVGDEHGTDEGDIHQRQHAHAGVSEQLNDAPGKDIEELNVLERADYRQHAEQAGQGLHVEVTQILRIHRHHNAGEQRCVQRNRHDNVCSEKGNQLFERFPQAIEEPEMKRIRTMCARLSNHDDPFFDKEWGMPLLQHAADKNDRVTFGKAVCLAEK